MRNHITAVFAKIGVENRAQAIVQAREAGLAGEPAADRDTGPGFGGRARVFLRASGTVASWAARAGGGTSGS